VKRRHAVNIDDRRWGRVPRFQCSGKILRDARESASLTLRVVSDSTGIAGCSISDMERGIVATPLHHVHVLCRSLKLDQAKLVEAILQDKLFEVGLLGFEVRVAPGPHGPIAAPEPTEVVDRPGSSEPASGSQTGSRRS